MSIPVLSVSQLTSLIKETLEGVFPAVSLEGEISNYRPSSTGHLYFTLKDQDAAISAVMFKGKSRYLDFLPADGMTVKVSGSVSVYAQRGSYQIIIDSMEKSGAGDILRLLEERKQRLAAAGLFDSERKKPLPFWPQTIGVVSSPTGAAVQDILNIVRRRNSCVSVIVFPATVQGVDAAETIIRQIQIANLYKMADVLIVGRGGGSLEDLLPFSDEKLVWAIAESEIPIVSAVGHEIDWALSDFAADLRAPTPSAAAEIVTPLKEDIIEQLEEIQIQMQEFIKHKVDKMRLLVASFSLETMELKFRRKQQMLMQSFDSAREELVKAMQNKLERAKTSLQMATHIIEAGSPTAILARGYSMVTDKASGKIIRSPKDTVSGATLIIQPAEGMIEAKIISSEE